MNTERCDRIQYFLQYVQQRLILRDLFQIEIIQYSIIFLLHDIHISVINDLRYRNSTEIQGVRSPQLLIIIFHRSKPPVNDS